MSRFRTNNIALFLTSNKRDVQSYSNLPPFNSESFGTFIAILSELKNKKRMRYGILMIVGLCLSTQLHSQKLSFNELIEASCSELDGQKQTDELDVNGLIVLVNEITALRENDCQRQVLLYMKNKPGLTQERAQEIFYLDFYRRMFDTCPKFMAIAHKSFGEERNINPALVAISESVTEALEPSFDGTYQEKMDYLMASLEDIWHANSDLIYENYMEGFEDPALQPDVAKYLLLHNDQFARLTVLCLIDKKRRN